MSLFLLKTWAGLSGWDQDMTWHSAAHSQSSPREVMTVADAMTTGRIFTCRVDDTVDTGALAAKPHFYP